MEPVIITAFWDVGRGNNCLFPRSNEKYYQEFAAWARIKNQMIVYTDENSAERIRKIRNDYGLLDRTRIIVQKNIFQIEPEIYSKMCEIESNLDWTAYKYDTNEMSNRANFDYAWIMKFWCINDARQYVDDSSLMAWMDFGFNHINACYANMEEFDFLWDCPTIDMNKIHIFSENDPDKITTIDQMQLRTTLILGVFYLVPSCLAATFWSVLREAIFTLFSMGLIDNDQNSVFIAYKNHPEIFEVHMSHYFLALKEFGATHLTLNKPTKIKKIRQRLKMLKRTIDFTIRSFKRADKYHKYC